MGAPARPTAVRTSRRAILAVIGVLLLVGCSSASSSPASPSGSAATGPPPAVTLADLVANPAAYNGRTVLVTASYYSGNGQQLLCDTFLDSYPPQPGGNSFPLTGTMPAQSLAQLQSTSGQPNMAQATWGQVSVIGVVHSGGGLLATLEMQSVRVEQGGVAVPLK
jgi:hypothetical protein